MSRRLLALVLGLTLVLPAGLSARSAGPKTTVDRTIKADGKKLEYGPGRPYVTRALDVEPVKGAGTPIAGFKHLSDVHVIDEESPARLEFFDACDPDTFQDSWRKQDALTTQVAESMMRTLARFDEGPVTGVPLSFALATGDNIDSNQFNELRWFIDLLDGETVEPNSGDDGYHGYTKAEAPGAFSNKILGLAQEPFDSTGVGPWYSVPGNHDSLVRGVAANSPEYNNLVTGGRKPFIPIDDYKGCENAENGGATSEAISAFLSRYARDVPQDLDRRFFSPTEYVQEFFNTTGEPDGHGYANAPEGATYYAFDIAPQIVGLSIDTVNYQGNPSGTIPDAQFAWLEQQLQANSSTYIDPQGQVVEGAGADRMVMLFSHHSSRTLDAPGTGDGGPYHCFRPDDHPDCGGEGLLSLLQRYPNVIAWVNGHEHNHALRPFGVPVAPERGFWEINTASHIDWGQQARLIEIAQKGDTLIIHTTVLDHGAPPRPNPKGDPVQYLASLSRLASYQQSCLEGQSKCDRSKAAHRNVRLLQAAPFPLAP